MKSVVRGRPESLVALAVALALSPEIHAQTALVEVVVTGTRRAD